MKGKLKKKQKICASCGGRLALKNQYTYKCPQCGREYYLSVDRTKRVRIRLSVGKMIIIIAAVLMGATTVGVVGYQYYTGKLLDEASRFSVAFRDFLMEVYGNPIAQVSDEDLEKIRYLKIEKDKVYQFTYSFEDYYDYDDWETYEETMETVEIEASREDFSPTNLEYFTGLTRVELYTEGGANYVLPEENQLRYIACRDKMSRYGKSKFFQRLNPNTIEEIVISDADELSDLSFLEDLENVKRFTLKNVTLKNVEDFEHLTSIESITLENVVMKEEKVYEIVEKLLSIPSLKELNISGSSVWYITEEQWEELQEMYKGKITMRRE